MNLNEMLTEAVVVVPDREASSIVVRGSDRSSWLNGLVTCDVSKLAPGKAVYGLVVTKKGRIVSDLVIVERDGALVLVIPGSASAALIEIFDHHLVMEDVELAKDAPHVWFAHGKRARDLRVEGALVAELDRNGLGGAVIVSNDPVDVAGPARALGGDAIEEESWEPLRIARGIPKFGRDFDDQTYPQEATLEKSAVSFDKGCYLGQEVVCMLELRGHVKRKLVPVDLSEKIAPGPITDDEGKEIGRLTSVAELEGKPVGIAMLKLAFTTPGTKVHAGSATAHVR